MLLADQARIEGWMDSMADALRDKLRDTTQRARVVGIRTGGIVIASGLHQRLGCDAPLGELNINFYRDDFSRTGVNPNVGPSSLPVSIDDEIVLLVDDVLLSGRTIRAALNELFDFGRPSRVVLAVLVSRSGRELPIQADVSGENMELPHAEHLELSHDPLCLNKLGSRP